MTDIKATWAVIVQSDAAGRLVRNHCVKEQKIRCYRLSMVWINAWN